MTTTKKAKPVNVDTIVESHAARQLRLAKHYWLETILPHIKGRRLSGAELCIATDAHARLQMAKTRALEWNHTEDGKRSPVPLEIILELDGEQFRAPQPLFADETLTPEKLAAIAAPLVTERPAAQAVRIAHELLMAAEDYLRTLPKNDPSWETEIRKAFHPVTFDEIVNSTKENSAQLPFLPGVREKQARLEMGALRLAVSRFMQAQIERLPKLTKQEYEKGVEQDQRLVENGSMFRLGTGRRQTHEEWQEAPRKELKKSLELNQITIQTLCDLRWTRFVTFKRGQSNRRAGKTVAKKTRPHRKKERIG